MGFDSCGFGLELCCLASPSGSAGLFINSCGFMMCGYCMYLYGEFWR